MLTHVELYDSRGALVLRVPVQKNLAVSPYYVRDIDGLGPVRATLSMDQSGVLDGDRYENARVGGRNIILDIGYEFDRRLIQTARQLREGLYSAASPKTFVTVRFIDDSEPSLQTSGIVESNDPLIFGKDLPYSKISIVTEDSYLSGLRQMTYTTYANQPVVPNVVGTAEYGFTAEISIKQAVSQIRISNGMQPDMVIRRSFSVDDVLEVSTIPRRKYLILNRYGARTSILGALKEGRLDLTLGPGSKSLLFGMASNYDESIVRVRHIPQYIGV